LVSTGIYLYQPAIETILGYRPEEITGKYFVDIARKEDMAKYVNPSIKSGSKANH